MDLTSERTVFALVMLLQREREKKIKKSCNVFCKNQELDRVVHEAIFDRKYDWSTEVKGRYACVKTQCTIDSVVQIFRLVKVIQRKALCRENVGEIQLQTTKVFLEIVEQIDSHSDQKFDITILVKMMEEKLSGNNVLYLM